MFEESAFLLVPTFDSIAEQRLTLLPGLGERGITATVDPTAGAFEHHDLGGDPFEQRTVVTHHQDGAWAVDDLFFEPDAGRDIEIVVRLIEQEYVGTRCQQQVEYEPFAFATGQFADLTSCKVFDRGFDAAFRRGSPSGFELVATEITPGGDGLGELHAVVGAVIHRLFGSNHGFARCS